ncbi:MAG: alpha-galactosidase [Terriglobia bacterium]
MVWEGTPEVEDGYGGKQTKNETFLPRHNAEVRYFGLGQVSSLNVHSLFDRKTDTAIQFSDRTRMQRNPEDPNFLKVTIPAPVNTLVRVIPDYYTKSLHVPYYVPFDDSYFQRAPMAWNSWDNYYESVTEEDIVRNTNWIAKNLKSYGFQYIVLDDGYDRGGNGIHYWIKNWDKQKFPHGPQWLANYIKSKGLIPGLWLVPNSYGGAVTQHPDWYLRYDNGKIVEDYHTPALDSTNPAVLNFLKREFSILNNWGFEYYKFDGEYAIPAYVPNVDKNRLYDKSIDTLAAYRNRLKVIREAIGPRRFIEGCPAGTPLNGIGYFDSYFYGDDMRPTWEGNYALLSSLNANAFLNHIVVYAMAGEGVEIGPPMSVAEASKKRVPQVLEAARARENSLRGFGTTTPEARTLVSYLALSGVVYSLSSVMPELPPDRVKLLKMTLPTMPILPIDLFSRGGQIDWQVFNHTTADDYIHNYPRVLDLKVNAKSGIYDVVGLTNWHGRPETRTLSFAKQLGLDPTRSYVAFDFWNQKLYGLFKDRMKVDIQPHDTRVFLIHSMVHRPQLIGTSRHITGAYSIQQMAWDESKHQLRGSSQGAPGEEYALWFYVPKDEMVSGVAATTGTDQELPVDQKLSGNLFKVAFQGRAGPVDWEVSFVQHATH